MAGYLGGVFAMIFAVPAYTLLRIVVNEFFGSQFASETEREQMLATDNKEHQSSNDNVDNPQNWSLNLFSLLES